VNLHNLFDALDDIWTFINNFHKTDAFGHACGNRVIGPDTSPQHLLDVKERELEKLRDGVGRLKDLFVIGDLTKPEYKTRLERLKDLTVKKENEVD